MKHIVIIFFVLSIGLSFIAYSQDNAEETIIQKLGSLSDKNKVFAYARLADLYHYKDFSKAKEFGFKAVKLAEKINFQDGLAKAYGSLGSLYAEYNKDQAIEFVKKSLEIRKKMGNKLKIALNLQKIARIYRQNNDYYFAVDYYMNAIKIWEQGQPAFSTYLADAYNSIAFLEMELGSYDLALSYYKKSLNIFVKNKYFTSTGAVIPIQNLGDLYFKLAKYDISLQYYNQALSLYSKSVNSDKPKIATIYSSIANVYKAKKDTVSALRYYSLSYRIFKELKIKGGLAEVQNGIASLYHENGDTKKSIAIGLAAYKNAKESFSFENMSEAANLLQENYAKTNDYQNAFYYLSIYSKAKDSLYSADRIKNMTKKEVAYRLEHLKTEQEAQIEKQKFLINALSIIVFLFLVIFAYSLYRYKQKRKSSKAINELMKQLEELNLNKTKFFSDLSQDYKRPLTDLVSSSRLLSTKFKELNEFEKINYANNIYELSQSTYKQVENLLEWTRVQSKYLNLLVDFNEEEIKNSK